MKINFPNFLKLTIYFLIFSILLLISCELFLRFLEPQADTYHMFPPNSSRTFKNNQAIIHGVSPLSRFTINSYGVRGKEPVAGEKRVLVIGGSAVESLILDDKKHWPEILGRKLNVAKGAGSYWVGNAGRSGITSFENILQIRHLPETIPHIDSIIALMGGNDMAISLRRKDEKAEEIPLKTRYERTFLQLEKEDGFPKNLALYRMAKYLSRFFSLLERGTLLWGGKSEAYANWVTNTRRERQNAMPFVEEAPNLSKVLQIYKRNLIEMVLEATKHGVKLILVTQPQAFRPNLSDMQEATFGGWWGALSMTDAPETRQYYSSAVLYKAARLFDTILLEVCEDHALSCIDAAAEMEPRMEFYYDGIHYSDKGSERLAEIVFSHLLP